MDRLYRDRVALPLCLSYLNMAELLGPAQVVCKFWQLTIHTDRLVWSDIVHPNPEAKPFWEKKSRKLSTRFYTLIRQIQVDWFEDFNLEQLQPFEHCTKLTIVGAAWRKKLVKGIRSTLPASVASASPLSSIVSLNIQVYMDDETILYILQHPRLSQLRELAFSRFYLSCAISNYLSQLVHLKKLGLNQTHSEDFPSIFETIHLMPNLDTLSLQSIPTSVRPLPSTITNLTLSVAVQFMDLNCVVFQPCQHQLRHLHLTLTDYLPSLLHRAQLRRFFTWLQERDSLHTLHLQFENFQQIAFGDLCPAFAPFVRNNASHLVMESIYAVDGRIGEIHFRRSVDGFTTISNSILVEDNRPALRFNLERFLQLFPAQLSSLECLTLNRCTLTLELVRALSTLPPNRLSTLKFIRTKCPKGMVSPKTIAHATELMKEFFLIMDQQRNLTYLQINVEWNPETVCSSEMFLPLLSCTRLLHLALDFTLYERSAHWPEPANFSSSVAPSLLRMPWLTHLELTCSSFWTYKTLEALLSTLNQLRHFHLGNTHGSTLESIGRLPPTVYEPILTLLEEYESSRPIRILLDYRRIPTWRMERLPKPKPEPPIVEEENRDEFSSSLVTLPTAPSSASSPQFQSCCTIQ